MQNTHLFQHLYFSLLNSDLGILAVQDIITMCINEIPLSINEIVVLVCLRLCTLMSCYSI